jgi:glycerophosphoryl diester phosphodiesterase
MREIVLHVARDFRRTWRRLFVIDLAYKLAAFVAIWPLAGLALRLCVATSGSSAIADQDILYFVLSPVGFIAVIVGSALVVAIVALEQACLMMLGLGATRHVPLRVTEALLGGARFAVPVLRVSFRAVLNVVLLSAPFLALGGLVYWLLLTEFDINYYLAERPPAFWTAAGLLAIILAILAVVLIPRVLSWSLALPVVLFDGISPGRALGVSAERTMGHRARIACWLAGWGLTFAAVSALHTALVIGLGRLVVPLAKDSIAFIVSVAGVLMLLWVAGNALIAFAQAATLALFIVHLHERLGGGGNDRRDEHTVLTGLQQEAGRFTSLRSVWLGLCGVAIASALLGAWLLHRVRFEDNVVVIAHRGASASAPENTMAAFRRAIDDGADQVELDVQETSDGDVVVIHDSDLMKIGGVDLKIWDAKRAELDEIDIGSHFSADFSSERVPSLRDVLQLCKDKVIVNIELKYYGHDQQLEQRVAETVEAAGMQSQVIVMSLEYPAVKKMKQLRPKWTVGLLSATAIGDLTKLEADFVAVNAGMAIPQFIKRAHARGKLVYVWTVNDPVQMSRLMSMGVDGVITDKPGLAKSVLTRRSQLSSIERLMITLAYSLGTVPRTQWVEQ